MYPQPLVTAYMMKPYSRVQSQRPSRLLGPEATSSPALVAITLFAAACGGDTETDPAKISVGAAGSSEVAIASFAFSGPVTVKTGTTGTSTNKDSAAHTVTATDEAFDSKKLDAGKTFIQKFEKFGTFNYKCNIHFSMTSSVKVE